MQFPKVLKVRAIKKYKIEVQFVDGTKGFYDLSHLAGKGVFKLWDEGNNFSNVFISKDSGAISWKDQIDLDTLNVYCKIKGISPGTFLQNQEHHATY